MVMLEPYQFRKIPIVFIHGLLSDPKTWLHIAIEYSNTDQINTTVLEDLAMHAEDAQARFEEIRQHVWDIGVPFEDSYSPPKAVLP